MPGNTERPHGGTHWTITRMQGWRIVWTVRRRVGSLPYTISKQWCVREPASGCQFQPKSRRRSCQCSGHGRSRRIGHPAVHSITASHSGSRPWWGGDIITICALSSPCQQSSPRRNPKVWQCVTSLCCHRAEAYRPADTGPGDVWLQRQHPQPAGIIPARQHAVIIVTGIHLKAQSPLPKIRYTLNTFCLGLCRGKCGQQHRRQNGDDGDDHE